MHANVFSHVCRGRAERQLRGSKIAGLQPARLYITRMMWANGGPSGSFQIFCIVARKLRRNRSALDLESFLNSEVRYKMTHGYAHLCWIVQRIKTCACRATVRVFFCQVVHQKRTGNPAVRNASVVKRIRRDCQSIFVRH